MLTPEPDTAGLTAADDASRNSTGSTTSGCSSAPGVAITSDRTSSVGLRPTTCQRAPGTEVSTAGQTCSANQRIASWLVATSNAPTKVTTGLAGGDHGC